jgi:hypothetical protein
MICANDKDDTWGGDRFLNYVATLSAKIYYPSLLPSLPFLPVSPLRTGRNLVPNSLISISFHHSNSMLKNPIAFWGILMNLKFPFYLFTIFLSASLFSCGSGGGGGSDGGDNSGSAQFTENCSLKVFGGGSCLSDQGPVTSIFPLNATGDPISLCTGTFVTKKAILTAAHCLSPSFLQATPNSVLIRVGSLAYRASRWRINPNYIATENGNDNLRYDVAVVLLDQDADVNTIPLLGSKPINVGDEIIAFGFGRTGDNQGAIVVGDESLKSAKLTVALKSEGLIYVSSKDDGICNGDSGGPGIILSAAGSPGVVSVNEAKYLESCKASSVSIPELETLIGRALTDEEKTALQQELPNGLFPGAVLLDIQDQGILNFLGSAIDELSVQ